MPYRTVLMFGPPGSGKGTWGNVLKQIPGMYHFSSGDMFRALDPDSPMGKMTLESIRKGELVPDHQAVVLWREQMARLANFGEFDPLKQYLILDGLPRTSAQVAMVKDDLDVQVIVALDCPDRDVLVQRLYRRALMQHRVDDANETTILKRFEVYDELTEGVLKHYPNQLIHTVDVSNPPQRILADISMALVDHLG
jgi:adenylate kinase